MLEEICVTGVLQVVTEYYPFQKYCESLARPKISRSTKTSSAGGGKGTSSGKGNTLRLGGFGAQSGQQPRSDDPNWQDTLFGSKIASSCQAITSWGVVTHLVQNRPKLEVSLIGRESQQLHPRNKCILMAMLT